MWTWQPRSSICGVSHHILNKWKHEHFKHTSIFIETEPSKHIIYEVTDKWVIIKSVTLGLRTNNVFPTTNQSSFSPNYNQCLWYITGLRFLVSCLNFSTKFCFSFLYSWSINLEILGQNHLSPYLQFLSTYLLASSQNSALSYSFFNMHVPQVTAA